MITASEPIQSCSARCSCHVQIYLLRTNCPCQRPLAEPTPATASPDSVRAFAAGQAAARASLRSPLLKLLPSPPSARMSSALLYLSAACWRFSSTAGRFLQERAGAAAAAAAAVGWSLLRRLQLRWQICVWLPIPGDAVVQLQAKLLLLHGRAARHWWPYSCRQLSARGGLNVMAAS